MIAKQIILNKDRRVTLDIFLQDVNGEYKPLDKRPGILILPGGAYETHSQKEADSIAFAYLRAGFQAFVLRYSISQFKEWPNPLSDYEAAMEYLINNSKDLMLDVDRIALIGFSAGGHLAFSSTVLSKLKPAALILGYPALIEETLSTLSNVIYPLETDNKDIPPVFVFHTRNDELVSVKNTLELQEYLYRNNINFESHIYSYGGHGFALGDKTMVKSDISIRAKNWYEDTLTWLDEVWGEYSLLGFGEPKYTNRVNDDSLDYLTCDCTVSKIKRNKSAVNLIKQATGIDITKTFSAMKLSSLLNFAKQKDKLDELNNELKKLGAK